MSAAPRPTSSRPEAAFLLITALGDGSVAQIPLDDRAEVDRMWAVIVALCERNGRPLPAGVLWQRDGDADRLLWDSEDGPLLGLPST